MITLRMSTAVAALALALAGAERASAQSLSGGVRADVALASFQNADFESSQRVGVRAGLYGDLDLQGPIGIRGEVVYAMKGVKNDESASDLTVKLDYIEVPVMAKVGLGTGSGLFLLAGPAVGFKISSKLSSGSSSMDYGDLVKPVDFGLVGGLGLEASLGGTSVTLDVRYTWGMRAVYDFGDPEDSDSDDKTQVISAGVGIGLF